VFNTLCHFLHEGLDTGIPLPNVVTLNYVADACDVNDNVLAKYVRDLQIFRRISTVASRIRDGYSPLL